MSIKYRPEIDGLRTVAVFSVVLYHANLAFKDLNLFKGGFIGVDVFFVISGYLITMIILKELQKGHFSFAYFYERRARRILPALFTVMLVSIPLAWQYMLPIDMKAYAGSLLSALGFGSNIWFWQEDSYAAAPSALKPLLHTWSLSVEEQFYVVFPILLCLLYRFGRKSITWVFIIVCLLSLQLAQWGSTRFPDANFFLLPSRGWELLAGAILARIELEKGRLKYPFWGAIMPTLGLFLICSSVVFFDDKTPHPSYITALPILGTMFLIWFCREGEWITRLLSSKPFVSIGLISYGFYLWHFPVFVFSRLKGSTPSDIKSLKYIGLALLLAVLSYFFIEKPTRNRQRVKHKTFLIGIWVAFFMLLITGGAIYIYESSYAKRIEDLPAYAGFKIPEFRRLKSQPLGTHIGNGNKIESCTMRDPHQACRFGNEKFVTLGDSCVGHYEETLRRKLDEKGDGMISLSAEQCPFVSDQMWFGNFPQCAAMNTKRWGVINQFHDKKIFIISAEFAQFEMPKGVNGAKPSQEDVIKSFQQNILKLLERGHFVVLISSPPGVDRNLVFKWKKQLLSRKNGSSFKPQLNSNPKQYMKAKNKEEKFRVFELEHPHLVKISVPDILCKKEADNRCLVISELGSIYNNESHLSYIGAEMILESVFFEITKRKWVKWKSF